MAEASYHLLDYIIISTRIYLLSEDIIVTPSAASFLQKVAFLAFLQVSCLRLIDYNNS